MSRIIISDGLYVFVASLEGLNIANRLRIVQQAMERCQTGVGMLIYMCLSLPEAGR